MNIWFLFDEISDKTLNSKEVFDLFKESIGTVLN